jgi:hypothetical protein
MTGAAAEQNPPFLLRRVSFFISTRLKACVALELQPASEYQIDAFIIAAAEKPFGRFVT